MSYRRDHRSSRSSLLDGYDSIEEGGIRASKIDEHSNEEAMSSLHDRVTFLKRYFLRATKVNQKLTGDIHEEVETHNRMLDRVGNGMDSTRGIMSTTMSRFKMVMEKKSYRGMCKLAGLFIVSFFLIYFLFRVLGYFMYS